MEQMNNAKEVLTLTDGRLLTLGGVTNILSFDEEYLTLETARGKVSVEGRDLKIESLTKGTGEVVIVGEITGFYKTPEKKEKRGAFGIFGK